MLMAMMPKKEKRFYNLFKTGISELPVDPCQKGYSVEPVLHVIDKLAAWGCMLADQRFGTHESVLSVFQERVVPLEVELLFNLAEVKRFFLTHYPLLISDQQMVGAVFKRSLNGRKVHFVVMEEGFLEKNRQLGLKGIRFLICRIDGQAYILKPDRRYNMVSSRHRNIPLLMQFMGIQHSNPKILERNRVAHDINGLLRSHHRLPSVRNVNYRQKGNYTAIEYVPGTLLVDFSKAERIELFQKPHLCRDMYSKQLLDALVGNCDANPTNILIGDAIAGEGSGIGPGIGPATGVISIDYDVTPRVSLIPTTSAACCRAVTGGRSTSRPT